MTYPLFQSFFSPSSADKHRFFGEDSYSDALFGYLMAHSGYTNKIFGEDAPNLPGKKFAAPFRSFSDCCWRVCSVITGSIAATLGGVLLILDAVLYAWEALFFGISGNTEALYSSIQDLADALLGVVACLFLAAINPLINSADCIIGSAQTLYEAVSAPQLP